MQLNLGDTFRPQKFDSHLWVVSSKPEISPVVIFNLTTYTIDEEEVCVLDMGEHPFITHKTAVRYGEGKRVEVNQLEKLIKEGQLKPHERASEAILKKIWLGASLSQRIKPTVLDILENQGLLPD
jgi:hypothetical protein